MSRKRVVLAVFGLVFGLSGLLGGLAAPQANAVGVAVYRTDSAGHRTGNIVNVGNTGSTAGCAGFGVGNAAGAAVCYLPIP